MLLSTNWETSFKNYGGLSTIRRRYATLNK